MTPVRRQQKPRLARLALGLAVVLLLAGGLPRPEATQAQITELVVTDRLRGLAIDGYDPVDYFVAGEPTVGKPDFEHRHARTVWRFRNEGNRAAFVQDPELYMPVFGGYDPMGLGRGVVVAGNATIWLIHDNSLFLFFSSQAREAFKADPAKALVNARTRWPDLSKTLVHQ